MFQQDQLVGQYIGDYKILRLLGHGSFADVYLIQKGNALFALKIMRSSTAEEVYKRFWQEAKTLQQLIHPRIVKAFHDGVWQNRPFFMMQYADNGNLFEYLKQRTVIELEQAVFIAYQIGEGLQHLHNEGIVHRDVKPENCLFTRDWNLLLSDFGLMAVHPYPREKFPLGTPAYMAPEQIRYEAIPATDQYSLAVMTYEMITGSRPFIAETPQGYLLQHKENAPRPFADFGVFHTGEIEKVVMKGLAKEPGERFPSVMEYIQALEQALAQCSRITEEILLPDVTENHLKVPNEYYDLSAKKEKMKNSILDKKFQNALVLCDEILSFSPLDIETYLNKALVLQELERYEEAIEVLETILKLNPRHPEAGLYLGALLSDLGWTTGALAAVKKILQADPGNKNARYLKKELDAKSIKKQRDADRDLADLQVTQGLEYMNQKQLSEALTSFGLAIYTDPEYAIPHFYSGVVSYQMGRPEEALVFFSQAINMEPAYADAYYAKGRVYMHFEKYKEAAAAFEQVIAYAPDETNVHQLAREYLGIIRY